MANNVKTVVLQPDRNALETVDLKINFYLRDKTKYEFDIFYSYFQYIDRINEKGKVFERKMV